MRECKTCSFFGHRKIETTKELKCQLTKIIEELIVNNNVETFLFGSRSEFDELCYMAVTELKEKYPEIKRMAYTCSSEICVLENEREKWEKIYSQLEKRVVRLMGFEGECEYEKKYMAGKASYVERNQAMIDDSDYCVFYYNEDYRPELRKWSKRSLSFYQPKSGTATAFNYARKKQKHIINLFDNKKTV